MGVFNHHFQLQFPYAIRCNLNNLACLQLSCTFAPAFSFSSVAFNAIHSISLSIYADNLDALTALSVSLISVSLPLFPPLSTRLCLCFLASVRVATSPCTSSPSTVACGAHAAHDNDNDDVQIAHAAAAAAAETAATNSTPRPLAGIRLRAGTLPLPHSPPPSLFTLLGMVSVLAVGSWLWCLVGVAVDASIAIRSQN